MDTDKTNILFSDLEARSEADRESSLFVALGAQLKHAKENTRFWTEKLGDFRPK